MLPPARPSRDPLTFDAELTLAQPEPGAASLQAGRPGGPKRSPPRQLQMLHLCAYEFSIYDWLPSCGQVEFRPACRGRLAPYI